MMQHYDSVDYELLSKQLVALMSAESDALANSANFTGLLYNAISDINWLGIYVLRGDELVLGPFQGKPACVRLPLGRGVCGNAAKNQKTLRIEDVHEFDGHIACDSASRSEIVVPLISSGTLLGVLDVDSPGIGRFSEVDQSGIEKLCTTFVEQLGLREMGRREFI
jgi:L-methionine (R)-S-oxide reductase